MMNPNSSQPNDASLFLDSMRSCTFLFWSLILVVESAAW